MNYIINYKKIIYLIDFKFIYDIIFMSIFLSPLGVDLYEELQRNNY